MYKNIKNIMCSTAIAALLVVTTFAAGATAAPKRLATANPDNCAACHGKEKILPADHSRTAKMTLASCRECHAKGSSSSLAGKLPLSHVHQLAGVTCVKCHGKAKKKQEVEYKVCLSCHDADKLAAKTATVKPENPHNSPHYGTSLLDCNVCHHQHAKSENFCIQCHSFDFKLP